MIPLRATSCGTSCPDDVAGRFRVVRSDAIKNGAGPSRPGVGASYGVCFPMHGGLSFSLRPVSPFRAALPSGVRAALRRDRQAGGLTAEPQYTLSNYVRARCTPLQPRSSNRQVSCGCGEGGCTAHPQVSVAGCLALVDPPLDPTTVTSETSMTAYTAVGFWVDRWPRARRDRRGPSNLSDNAKVEWAGERATTPCKHAASSRFPRTGHSVGHRADHVRAGAPARGARCGPVLVTRGLRWEEVHCETPHHTHSDGEVA